MMGLNEIMFTISNLSTSEKVIFIIIILFMIYLAIKIIQSLVTYPINPETKRKNKRLRRLDRFVRDTVCCNVMNNGIMIVSLYKSLAVSYVTLYYWINQFDDYVNQLLCNVYIRNLKSIEYVESYDSLCDLSDKLHDLRRDYIDLMCDDRVEPKATAAMDRRLEDYYNTFGRKQHKLFTTTDIKECTSKVWDICDTARGDYTIASSNIIERIANDVFSIIDGKIDDDIASQFVLIEIVHIGSDMVDNVRENIDLVVHTSNKLSVYLNDWLNYETRVREHLESSIDDGKVEDLLEEGAKMQKTITSMEPLEIYCKGFIMKANVNQFRVWMVINLLKDYMKGLRYSDLEDQIRNMSEMVKYGDKYKEIFIPPIKDSKSYLTPYTHIFGDKYVKKEDCFGINLPDDIGKIQFNFNKKEFDEFVSFNNHNFMKLFVNSCKENLSMIIKIHDFARWSYVGLSVFETIVKELLTDENK